jgi:hypothetical protein
MLKSKLDVANTKHRLFVFRINKKVDLNGRFMQVTQPGQKPDLMRVKCIMGRNSPGKDGNLHTVRKETARYSFCMHPIPDSPTSTLVDPQRQT